MIEYGMLWPAYAQQSIKENNIKNPTIVYAGSSTHYNNSDTGDWNKALIEFVHNNLNKYQALFTDKAVGV